MAIKTSNQITFSEQRKIVEIKEWYLATTKESGVTREDEGWTSEIQTINETNKYLWNYEEVVYSIGSSEVSDPVVIGFFGKGTDGKGIAGIKNYYCITKNPMLPESPVWSEVVLMITPANKYLWNYDEITYTDGSSYTSEPAIIGVYGDSGTDSVDFQIYSVDGFEFSDTLTSIELKTVAFSSGVKLEGDDIVYQWKWWNEESELYENIPDAIEPTFVVNYYDIYSSTGLKCEILYNGTVYEDYVSLTKKTSIYTAVANFFNGSNTISSDSDYLVVYIELYKDNNPEELLYTDSIYKSDVNNVQDNIITTDLSGEYVDGDMMYFVCKKPDTTAYDVVCGKYTSGAWNVLSNNYVYKNDLYVDSTSPVVFVPKEKISKSLNINFTILDGDSIVARTNATVLDLNDPSVGGTAPTSPQKGQLWLDTSVPPSILKMWDGAKWVNSGYQNGNVVYTSRPDSWVSEGDLWILADGEYYGENNKYGPGSLLRAKTNASGELVWVDAMNETTKLLNEIKQTFTFDPNDQDGDGFSGLKIGQSDAKFFVNISSTRMSFIDNSDINDAQEEEVMHENEVVYISNRSATIKNVIVEENAEFNCPISVDEQVNIYKGGTTTGFKLQLEGNGSFSLVVAK